MIRHRIPKTTFQICRFFCEKYSTGCTTSGGMFACHPFESSCLNLILNWVINHADSNLILLIVFLWHAAPNTNEQMSRSELCESVIRRSATEARMFVCSESLKKLDSFES